MKFHGNSTILNGSLKPHSYMENWK